MAAPEYTRAGLIERADALEIDAEAHKKNGRDNAALHCLREAGDLRALAATLPEDAVIVTDKDRIADLEVELGALRVDNETLRDANSALSAERDDLLRAKATAEADSAAHATASEALIAVTPESAPADGEVTTSDAEPAEPKTVQGIANQAAADVQALSGTDETVDVTITESPHEEGDEDDLGDVEGVPV